MTATDVQPAVSGHLLPLPGRYDLRGDRCVVALTVRPLGLPLLHTRLTRTDGHVVVDSDDEYACELELRWRRRRRFAFTSDRLLLGPDGPRRTAVLPGTVTVDGRERELRLSGILHHCDRERLVLWVHGKVDRVHVEAAAEFVR